MLLGPLPSCVAEGHLAGGIEQLGFGGAGRIRPIQEAGVAIGRELEGAAIGTHREMNRGAAAGLDAAIGEFVVALWHHDGEGWAMGSIAGNRETNRQMGWSPMSVETRPPGAGRHL